MVFLFFFSFLIVNAFNLFISRFARLIHGFHGKSFLFLKFWWESLESGVGRWLGRPASSPVVSSSFKLFGKYVIVQHNEKLTRARSRDVSLGRILCVNNPTLRIFFCFFFRKINFDRRKKFYNLKLSGD